MNKIHITVEPPLLRGGPRTITGILPSGEWFDGAERDGNVAFAARSDRPVGGRLLADGRGLQEAATMLAELEQAEVTVTLAPSKANPAGAQYTVSHTGPGGYEQAAAKYRAGWSTLADAL